MSCVRCENGVSSAVERVILVAQMVATSSAEADPLVGSKLGKDYLVLEQIGLGGMAVVYLVEHQTLLKRFAAKVLSSQHTSSIEARARFTQEAHAASQLDHENIVTISDFGITTDDRPYFVMELLRGKTLADRLDARPDDARRGGRGERASRARTRACARGGNHPSRRQAREHLPRPAQPGTLGREGPRLRHRKGDAQQRPHDEDRRSARQSDVHVAGGVPRRRSQSTSRHLFVRYRPLLDARGTRAVRRRESSESSPDAGRGAAAAADVVQSRPSGRAGARPHSRTVQGSERSLRDDGRVPVHARGRAARWRGRVADPGPVRYAHHAVSRHARAYSPRARVVEATVRGSCRLAREHEISINFDPS